MPLNHEQIVPRPYGEGLMARYNKVSVLGRSSLISTQCLKIALLDRDSMQATQVKSWIEDADCQCTHYHTVEEFQRGFYHVGYDLVILDWMERAPVCGQDVLSWLRTALGNTVPAVVTSSNHAERETVRALYAGADDYLVKPLRRNEFLARLHALVRRTHREPDLLSCHPHVFDAPNQQLSVGSEVVRLTRKEYELTVYLYRNRGRVVTRKELLASVWGVRALRPYQPAGQKHLESAWLRLTPISSRLRAKQSNSRGKAVLVSGQAQLAAWGLWSLDSLFSGWRRMHRSDTTGTLLDVSGSR